MLRTISLQVAAAALIAASLGACAGKTIPAPVPSRDAVNAEFEKIPVAGNEKRWIPAITVAFPASWPPADPPEIVYYAYAWNREGISDAERRTNVWGEFRTRRDGVGPIRFARLADSVAENGAQGVWPRMSPAPDWGAGQAELDRALRGELAPEKTKALKAAYCDWRQGSSHVANEIKDRQRDFFAWLDCPPARSRPR